MPLIHIHQGKMENGRLMRKSLTLQPYRFKVKSIKGRDNVGADFLSGGPGRKIRQDSVAVPMPQSVWESRQESVKWFMGLWHIGTM